jgi:glycosyltransferase involved in cell wall biosynthesis
MQKTSFDYELIIGDDFSSDGAREIVAAYQERHPDRIRALPTAHHLGAAENWKRVIAARRGAYVATLEGDDYWTSPEKLQVQADLLDQDPAIAVCGHQVTFLYEGQCWFCPQARRSAKRILTQSAALSGCVSRMDGSLHLRSRKPKPISQPKCRDRSAS